MSTTPIRPGPLISNNPRLVAVAAALAVWFGLSSFLVGRGGWLELVAFIFPAMEAAMFAAFVAIYRDFIAPMHRRHALTILVWFVVCLGIFWLYVLFTRAGINAYAKLGLPPAFNAPL